ERLDLAVGIHRARRVEQPDEVQLAPRHRSAWTIFHGPSSLFSNRRYLTSAYRSPIRMRVPRARRTLRPGASSRFSPRSVVTSHVCFDRFLRPRTDGSLGLAFTSPTMPSSPIASAPGAWRA